LLTPTKRYRHPDAETYPPAPETYPPAPFLQDLAWIVGKASYDGGGFNL
jgi:hypothetical protein